MRSEKSRELSRANKSLYEFLHPDEGQVADDPIVNHVVIKADVRGSTGITKDLLARGMNPASHFSMNLHEPVKRMLERYGAANVFIEGDAIILAIYEDGSRRAPAAAPWRAPASSRAKSSPSRRRTTSARRRAACRRSNWASASHSRIPRRRSGWTRLAHHDFPRAESFRPPFELLENGQAPVQGESRAVQRLPAANA